MIIVTGHLLLAADSRAAYLEDCADVVRQGRAAPGCLDFALSADVLDERRINILERWETRADVEAFRGAGTPEDESDRIVHAAVSEYDVTAERRLT